MRGQNYPLIGNRQRRKILHIAHRVENIGQWFQVIIRIFLCRSENTASSAVVKSAITAQWENECIPLFSPWPGS